MRPSLKLCFIENSHFAKSMAQGVLRDFDLQFFNSGEEAWQAIVYESLEIDILITDLDLPGMNGLELIEKIRRIDRIKDIPIVLISSESDHKMMMEGLDAGADSYLVKPYSQEKLMDCIQKLKLKTQVIQVGNSQSETLLNTVMDENDFLNNVFNTVSDAIWVLDNSGAVARMNQSAASLLGSNFKKYVGKSIDEIIGLELFEEEDTGLLSEAGDVQELKAHLKLNSIPMVLSKKDLTSEHGEVIGALVSAKDIREQQMLQKEVMDLEKWKSLGEMAAGIAHEVNNPVAIIRGWAENMEFERKNGNLDEKELESGIGRIIDMTERISKIISSLRVLARDGSKDEPEYVLVKTLIEDCTRINQRRVNDSGVEFKIEKFDEDLGVEVQRTQIAQVLLNLIVNAFDAVQGTKKAWVTIEVSENPQEVEIRVTDSGKGIPVEMHDKIFQPFFSTKDVKSGVGMGLSLSKAFVENNDGRLALDPKRKNTCFILALKKRQNVNVA